MTAPAGWYPDPTRRHGERYWAGAHWTEFVRDRGTSGVDPLEAVAAQSETEVATTTYQDTGRAELRWEGGLGLPKTAGRSDAPQGWYPTPGVPGEERYWDGYRWTNYTRPTRSSPAPGPVGSTRAARTNAKAVASLTLALVWLGGIGSILGIALGLLARREIARSSDAQRGAGLARAGIVVGVFGMLLAGLLVGTFVVLFLLARQ